jgi:hypothetical protein
MPTERCDFNNRNRHQNYKYSLPAPNHDASEDIEDFRGGAPVVFEAMMTLSESVLLLCTSRGASPSRGLRQCFTRGENFCLERSRFTRAVSFAFNEVRQQQTVANSARIRRLLRTATLTVCGCLGTQACLRHQALIGGENPMCRDGLPPTVIALEYLSSLKW